MFKKFKLLRDRLTIWAIMRFNFELPDLQQAESLKPRRVYYYYGRWVRPVAQPIEVKEYIHTALNEAGVCNLIPSTLGEMIASRMCAMCALHRLGLPCKKFKGGTVNDLCIKYRYQLIKGKKNDSEIESE